MQRQEVLTTLNDHKETLQGFGVKSLLLLGSVARDEARSNSDIDLLVEFDRPVGLFTFVRVQRYLEEILGRSIWAHLIRSSPICENLCCGRPFVPFRSWQNRIQDILEAITEIDRFTSSMTFEHFKQILKQ